MAGFIALLRTGGFLTRERVRLVAFGALAAALIGLVFLAAGANGPNDSYGRPLGTDFASFYAAGTLVRDGLAAQAFDQASHFAREQAIFGPATQYYAFQYPPVFLLVAGALAVLPYVPALIVWQVATLILYLLAMRAVLLIPPLKGEGDARSASGGGGIKSDWLLLALAFPAVFINLGHGQNGFFTVALFAGALALLDRRPLIAGMLIGLMIYKPQFGLMIPLVLIATGRWRVIFAAAATVAALMLVTFVAFGPNVWPAFFASMTFTRTVLLEQGDVGFFKMQSVFAWVRLWGGGVALAYVIQSLVTLGVAGALVWFWRSAARYPLKASALLIGTLLATPFCLDYDLMLLAPAIAFLAIDGKRDGFCAWHKLVLAALWLVPLIARSVAKTVSVPLAAPVMILAFIFVLQRAMSAGSGLEDDGALADESLK